MVPVGKSCETLRPKEFSVPMRAVDRDFPACKELVRGLSCEIAQILQGVVVVVVGNLNLDVFAIPCKGGDCCQEAVK